MLNYKTHIVRTYLSFGVGMFILLLSACSRHSDMQTMGSEVLQGVWEQDSIPGQQDMLSYTLHGFTFTCDSVYETKRVFSKVQRIADSCYNKGAWLETAKSVYVVRGDSIIAEGIYTKANGKYKASGCYNSGTYLSRFKIISTSADSLVLESKYDPRKIVLRKKQDIVCVPKKRWED